MEIIKSILFGIIEGITEWLPISSTGHLILLNQFISLDVSEDFWSVYEVVIQLGAILAVVFLFWHKLWPFGKKHNKYPVKENGFLSYCKKDKWILWFKILVSCAPAILFGLLGLDDVCDQYFYNPVCVAIALIVFGIAFIVIENMNKHKKPSTTKIAQLTYKDALIIGLFQLLAAVFPGTSRSGATIVGALLIGISRTVIAEYTFYLAIPVMFGASLLKMVKFGFDYSGSEIMLLAVGCITAFLVSIFVIKFFMGYVKNHNFKIFGWYRIVLGILVLAYFIAFK